MAARRPRSDPEGRPPLLDQVRDLAALVVQHGLTEIEVERGGTRIRVVRERAGAAAALAPAPGSVAPAARERAAGEREGAASSPLVTMEAPMVGTFYRAANPQAPPYVNEGDLIKEGQVVGVIEAMKLMNEIEARVSGRVARILVENGQPVEYGQPLFLVDPRA